MQDGWTSGSRVGTRSGYDVRTRRLRCGPEGRDGIDDQSALRYSTEDGKLATGRFAPRAAVRRHSHFRPSRAYLSFGCSLIKGRKETASLTRSALAWIYTGLRYHVALARLR